jgi:hypothetical protein
MNDKQIINILMNIVWDWADDCAVAVATLVNNDIPINVIADYYGKSETAEYLQEARDEGLID